MQAFCGGLRGVIDNRDFFWKMPLHPSVELIREISVLCSAHDFATKLLEDGQERGLESLQHRKWPQRPPRLRSLVFF
jgi:hypothetical protein